MGLYLNSEEPLTMYRELVNSPYFVDKTAMLGKLNSLLNTSSKYVCVTRPRRFGKSAAASMMGAYYSKAVESSDLFDQLQISKTEGYKQHLNKHNVIYIDFSLVDDACQDYQSYITTIKDILREDIHAYYPDVVYRKAGGVFEDLRRVNEKTGEQFVFVLDEWDAVFHMSFITEADQKSYLSFLKSLLKGRGYVSFAYMTGILPIAKYSSGSDLNMFVEYTMSSQSFFGTYFGFTEQEVNLLYAKYLEKNGQPSITRTELAWWYDGYHSKDGEHIYNPRSVVIALSNNQLGSYWTSSGPYDEIFFYIKNNIEGVRDDIGKMLAGEKVSANIQEYAAVSQELKTRDQILSAMVVYGFLTSDSGQVWIPNKELMDQFINLARRESTLGYVYQLAKVSDQMLSATLRGDTKTMLQILEQAHGTEKDTLGYNDETELSAVIRLIYLSARDQYDIQREDKAGVGRVDYIFYPVVENSADAIILELKVDDSAENAIKQIKDRQYIRRLTGKVGENPKYTGRIIAVGIAYYKTDKNKRHECRVEILREKLTVV